MELIYEQNRIFSVDNDGKLLAEIVFPDLGEHLVKITRTFVDPSLRGQGAASALMLAAAQKLRQEGKKAVPLCSYAKAWLERHPEYADLAAEIPAP